MSCRPSSKASKCARIGTWSTATLFERERRETQVNSRGWVEYKCRRTIIPSATTQSEPSAEIMRDAPTNDGSVVAPCHHTKRISALDGLRLLRQRTCGAHRPGIEAASLCWRPAYHRRVAAQMLLLCTYVTDAIGSSCRLDVLLKLEILPRTSSFCVSHIIRSGRPLHSSLSVVSTASARSFAPRRKRVSTDSGDAARGVNL